MTAMVAWQPKSPERLTGPDLLQVVPLLIQQVLQGQLRTVELRFGLCCGLPHLVDVNSSGKSQSLLRRFKETNLLQQQPNRWPQRSS